MLIVKYLQHLHPTMYLLIPANANIVTTIASKFTSHYVSINSYQFSEMKANERRFTSHYVSINSDIFIFAGLVAILFTSHYVSINSEMALIKKECLSNLHPTMYLLILCIVIAAPLLYLFTSHYVSINS